jgi:hypothetical protein
MKNAILMLFSALLLLACSSRDKHTDMMVFVETFVSYIDVENVTPFVSTATTTNTLSYDRAWSSQNSDHVWSLNVDELAGKPCSLFVVYVCPDSTSDTLLLGVREVVLGNRITGHVDFGADSSATVSISDPHAVYRETHQYPICSTNDTVYTVFVDQIWDMWD